MNNVGRFNAKFLGSVEIKRSLTQLTSNSRSIVLGAAVKKVLARYGRTNYHHSGDVQLETEFVGFSPVSPFNNCHCVIQVIKSFYCV